MKQNPFSFYDFLGYLVPGAIFFILIISILQFGWNEKQYITNFLNLYDVFHPDNHKWIELLIFIFASYSLGHVLSYLSSVTIERYFIWRYDYPSNFLLGQNKDRGFIYLNDTKKKTLVRINLLNNRFILNVETKELKGLSHRSLMWRALISIILFPLLIVDIILGDFLRFRGFYLKKLDNYLNEAIYIKLALLLNKLNLGESKDNDDCDYHRIIHHYQYEKNKSHQMKFDNYVALYGFLRCMSFLMNIFFLILVFCILCYSKFRRPDVYVILSLFYILSYIFFMGFIKFYRRYTLEGFMCLITDEDLVSKDQTQVSAQLKHLCPVGNTANP